MNWSLSVTSNLSLTSNLPHYAVHRMFGLGYTTSIATSSSQLIYTSNRFGCFVICGAKGPRPRYPRVWKSRKIIGTISKSQKLVKCIKGLSNVKEEVYGALDSFVAWELEFPLIAVKKALKTLESEREWKRVIQMTKWMLSKGQGKTLGSFYTLLNALAEDGRLEEAEELWAKIFSENLENLPHEFYTKMISIYYSRGMHEKMFEVFADMEELGMRPSNFVVGMMGNVFQKLDMVDKYEKLKKKYPPVVWKYRTFRGRRVRVPFSQPADEELGTKPMDQLKEESKEDEAYELHDAVDQLEEDETLDDAAHEQHETIDQLEEVGKDDADPVVQPKGLAKEHDIESIGQVL